MSKLNIKVPCKWIAEDGRCKECGVCGTIKDIYSELIASNNRLFALILSGYIQDEATKSNVNKQIRYNNDALAKAEGKE
jgi:hypothetical protein